MLRVWDVGLVITNRRVLKAILRKHNGIGLCGLAGGFGLSNFEVPSCGFRIPIHAYSGCRVPGIAWL